jgi:protease I
MAKALLFVENGFEDAEALYPYYRLQEAGFAVDVVGPAKGKVYTGKYGYPLTAGLAPADVDIAAYAAVIVPGGQAPDRMRVDEGLVEILRAAHARGVVIGAICHGPQLLIEADLVRGRNVTCYKSVLTDILNAGAIYHDLPAVVDANIVTSRAPADLPDFCREVLALLKK